MHTTYRTDRSNRWFEIRSYGERECFFVPQAVKDCARKWRCSRVFWNGVRAEPEMGTPCGALNGAAYSRQTHPADAPRPRHSDSSTEAALFLAGIAIGKALK